MSDQSICNGLLEKPLTHFAEINPSTNIPAHVRATTSVSFIPMADVTESGHWCTRQTRSLAAIHQGFTAFEEYDVLVAKITPCMENGKGTLATGLANGIGFGSTEFFVLRALPGSSPNFLFHVSQSKKLRNAAQNFMAGSAGQQRVQRGFFDSFFLPDFRFEEQKQIANILDILDATIRQTEAIIAKLQQVKQGMLHDLLTRGIDANGELRPPVEVAPELYKKSSFGWAPKEWEDILLDDIATRGSGHTPNKNVPSYWNGGIKWVSLADSDKLDNIYIYETDKKISTLGIANSSAVKHPAGTVVLSRDAGVGKSAILASEMAVSQHFMAWNSGKKLNNMFFYFWLQKQKPSFESIAIGSTIKTIGLPFFRKLRIMLPLSSEQDFIADILLTAEQNLTKHKNELNDLVMVKSGLMDDLLTGRVRVTPLIEEGLQR